MDILPGFPPWSSTNSGIEDLPGLERPCPGFPGPGTLLLSAQSALCSDAWPRKCSIGEIIVQFTFYGGLQRLSDIPGTVVNFVYC